MIRADLARELAHDNGGPFNALAVTDAQVDGFFTARGIHPVWSPDGLAAGGSGVTWPAQGFGAQASGALLDWPHQVSVLLFVEGSFQFLDGGMLDLGIIRDSILDSTNDYETFAESFEAVAFRGIESLHIVVAVRPNGESAAAASTGSY